MVDFHTLPNANDKRSTLSEFDGYVEGTKESLILTHRIISQLIEYKEHSDKLLKKYASGKEHHVACGWIRECLKSEYYYLSEKQYRWACSISNKIYLKLNKENFSELSYLYIFKLKEHDSYKIGVTINPVSRMRGIHQSGSEAFDLSECFITRLISKKMAYELEDTILKGIEHGEEYSPKIEKLCFNFGKTEWFPVSEVEKILDVMSLFNLNFEAIKNQNYYVY